MQENNTILNTDWPLHETITFQQFREAGMDLLQRLAGETWTDHNTHDPGITILEQLCYALTDLSYRIDFSMNDLMAEGETQPWSANFRPGLMLSSGPVHLKDWRKLLLDIPGVRNAWIYPVDTTSENYDARLFFDPIEETLRMTPLFATRDTRKSANALALQGLYEIKFIPEPGNPVGLIANRIRQRVHRQRNLCEDFHKIEPLAAEIVDIEGQIVMGEVSDPAALLAKIYFAVQEYLAPRIRFYSWQERVESGYTMEELLEGPLLEHGFLDDEELDTFQLRRSIRLSDIIRLIMDLDGVEAVKRLRLFIPDTDIAASTQAGEPWEMIMPDGSFPVLRIPPVPTAGAEPKLGLSLIQKGLPVRLEWRVATEWLKEFNRAAALQTKADRQDTDNLAPAAGRNRQATKHQSIQHQFPDLYGIGTIGLPRPVSPRRIAQSRQLKAYLTIFDQLLANAFAQLQATKELFSLRPNTSDYTYFSASLRDEIPNMEPLIQWQGLGLFDKAPTAAKAKAYPHFLQRLTEGGESEPARQTLWDRSSRLLNHLLARFGEELKEYDAILKEKLFQQKEKLLTNYQALSQHRFKAFDYTSMEENVRNVSSLETRIAILLGFPDLGRRSLRDLATDDHGGFHLVEHILLRPTAEDKTQEGAFAQVEILGNELPALDPFSFQLTFVFPDWLDRFDEIKNPGFRTAIIKTLREETPAHLKIYIRWLSPSEMSDFETSYLDWITNAKAT